MYWIDLVKDYKFDLKVDHSNEQYKISIEVCPELKIGMNIPALSPEHNEDFIKASKIELIANSPNLNGEGDLTINFIKGVSKISHKRKKNYHSTKKLLRDLSRYRTKIKRAHVKGKTCYFKGLEKIEDGVLKTS